MNRPAFKPQKRAKPGTPKDAIKRLFAQKGGIKEVEVLLSLKHAVVYGYADHGSDDEITFKRVAALTDPVGTAGAEYLAQRAGGVFVPLPRRDTPIGALTAEAVRTHGTAAAQLVDALRDSRLSQDEAAAAVPDLEAALTAMATLLSDVASIARGDDDPD